MSITSDSTRWYRGPAQVVFNDINLGDLQKGTAVEVNITPNVEYSMADQHGNSPVRAFKNGPDVEVIVYLRERDYATFNAALPSATYTPGDQTFRVDGGFEDLTSSAKTLVITPLATGHSGDVMTVHLALPSIGSFVYSGDEDQVIPVTFKGLVDTDNDNQLFTVTVHTS